MPSFAAPVRAIVRAVSPGYADCLRADQDTVIDVGAARAAHAQYVDALRESGVEVVMLAADPQCPDCCFVEDTAVLLGKHALSTRTGAQSRRAEVAKIAEALAATHEVHVMGAPATLDGGDVLRVAQTLFVGLSLRTNRAGVDRLSEVARLDGLTVVPIEVRAGLHLKSACSIATPEVLVYDPAVLAPGVFAGAGVHCIAASEPCGANVLALGRRCLVSAGAPKTAEALARAGVAVRMIDVAEFHKGDGALTCLSLRIAREGEWCV